MPKHLLLLSAAILSSALTVLAIGLQTDIDWPTPGPAIVVAADAGEDIDWP
ncbi:hypothetical protein [Streptomyces sp. NPDC086023]|uniref:hypothetical protein n=1 Tax=Streptomyces sp. NPDC086023 TaxID=3365746 RepID=UPI0037CDBBEF